VYVRRHRRRTYGERQENPDSAPAGPQRAGARTKRGAAPVVERPRGAPGRDGYWTGAGGGTNDPCGGASPAGTISTSVRSNWSAEFGGMPPCPSGPGAPWSP
jgi:hypothetical protein